MRVSANQLRSGKKAVFPLLAILAILAILAMKEASEVECADE
jgi:hypothetical protein